MTVLGAIERTCLTQEGTRDYPANFMLASQNVPRRFADFIKSFERNHFFMRGDLKHRVCRGVNDRLAGLYMFFAQLLNDLSAACRNVAENSRHLRLLDELIDDRLWKAVGIGRKRALQNDAGHLPVTGSRVLAVRLQRAFAITTARIFDRRHTAQRPNITEPQPLQIWQTKLPRFTDVTERI